MVYGITILSCFIIMLIPIFMLGTNALRAVSTKYDNKLISTALQINMQNHTRTADSQTNRGLNITNAKRNQTKIKKAERAHSYCRFGFFYRAPTAGPYLEQKPISCGHFTNTDSVQCLPCFGTVQLHAEARPGQKVHPFLTRPTAVR